MHTQLRHLTWGWLLTTAGRMLADLDEHRGEPWAESDLRCERRASR